MTGNRSDLPQPPPWADALLRRALPAHAETDAIIGDLQQEFEERLGSRSLAALRLRYAAHAVEIALRYTLLGARERLFPRIGRWRMGDAEVRPNDSGGDFMGSFVADLRYGVRMLFRTPVLTITAALTMGLGVALTTHAFSTVYGSLIRPPSVDPNGDLMYVQQTWPERGIGRMSSIPIHDYERFRDQQTGFTELAGYYQSTINMAGDEGPAERFLGTVGTANLLRVAGVAPLLGRVHQDGEDGPGSPRLVVLGYEAWQNRFAGDTDIVGRSVRLNSVSYDIIGVMPDGFRFPFDDDLWTTHQIDAATVAPRSGNYLETLGRLKPGVTDQVAMAEIEAIHGRTVQEFIETHEGIGVTSQGYLDRYMPEEIRAVLMMMMGAVVGVLLIASANVANLLLARATVRGREIAIRTALGADRKRVIRQMLIESALLGLVGGAIGLALAYVGIVVFNNALVDIEKPYWIDIKLDGAALLFTLAITLTSAVVAGTIPAIRASGLGIGTLLRDETRGSSSFRLGRFSSLLVVGELAVSCALLVGAGLMVRSVMNLRNMDMGFEGSDVMTATVVLPQNDYPASEDLDQFWGELQIRLEAEPAIVNATFSAYSPGTGSFRYSFGIEGEDYAEDADYHVTNAFFVSANYFDTYDIPILQGRTMSESEWRLEGDPVALVSESFARHYFGEGTAINERVRPGRSTSGFPWMRIVGVVPDVFTGTGDIGGLGSGQSIPDHIYTPLMVHTPSGAVIGMEGTGSPAELAGIARSVIREMDPNLPLFDVQTADEAVGSANWSFNLFGSLFAIFGAAALFLAGVGLYGVMAFGVARRRQEMGVRMALGAQPSAILKLVVRRGVTQLVIGGGLGLGLGALLSQPLSIALLGVDALDPVVYIAIALTMGGTGLAATLVPALRATRVDPSTALRPD